MQGVSSVIVCFLFTVWARLPPRCGGHGRLPPILEVQACSSYQMEMLITLGSYNNHEHNGTVMNRTSKEGKGPPQQEIPQGLQAPAPCAQRESPHPEQ